MEIFSFRLSPCLYVCLILSDGLFLMDKMGEMEEAEWKMMVEGCFKELDLGKIGMWLYVIGSNMKVR